MTSEPDDHSLRDFRRARRAHRLRVLVIALTAIAAVGLLPMPLSMGYFGWRLFRYNRVSLHFVNITGQAVTLEIGNLSETFESGRVHAMAFRAGDVELTASWPDGSTLETLGFLTDNQSVFYNLGAGHCYAVMDASAMYDEDRLGAPLAVINRIGPDDRIYSIPAGVFIPPRGITPDHVPSGETVIWIDDVACALLDPQEEHLLVAQQLIRMEGRRDERERRRRELQQQAQ